VQHITSLRIAADFRRERQIYAQQTDGLIRSDRLTSAMSLANALLHEISTKLFEPTETAIEPASERLGLSLAEALYGAADMKSASLPETEGREILASGLATILRLIERCAKEIAAVPAGASILDVERLLITSLETVYMLSDATAHSNDTLQLPWRVEEWTRHLIRCLNAFPASVGRFSLHSNIVSAILTLSKTPTIQPPLRRNQRALIEALTAKVCNKDARCVELLANPL
jgi:hypothetical protein